MSPKQKLFVMVFKLEDGIGHYEEYACPGTYVGILIHNALNPLW